MQRAPICGNKKCLTWHNQFGQRPIGAVALFNAQKCPIFDLFGAFQWIAVDRSEFNASPEDPLFMRFSRLNT
jgi:hypothetical protein